MHGDRDAPGAPFGAVALRSLAPLDCYGAFSVTVAAGQEFDGRSDIEGSLLDDDTPTMATLLDHVGPPGKVLTALLTAGPV